MPKESNFCYTDHDSEAIAHLEHEQYQQLPAAINYGETELRIIINLTTKQYWVSCKVSLNHNTRIAQGYNKTINYKPLDQIRKWDR
ncbi:hypothetical protein [Flavobacterium sp. HSC-61S13]|uniref:hypothetical protein n=1 Tax=Flavobacterium sp. HSC-61S13 TaxID=2910963 RepID=UPI00209E7362|nr:hypothetical protein [Flavobacterium sp. HSC-61S13]MCP1996619.1 hypothetical protein [Flavobacterium sp. HSC-61S13]